MFNHIFTTKQAQAGVNSAGMRNDGRAASGDVVAKSVTEALRAADAGNTADVHDIGSGAKFDSELVKRGVECINQSAREGATLTNKLFNLIRACKSFEVAKGTLVYAEQKAIKLADERSTASGGPRIKTLSAMAEANGMDKLSYVQIKSNLFKAYDDRKERGDYVQDYYNLKERLEKAPKTTLQAGWLDIWSERYADPKDGSRMFMKDVRFSAMCKVESDKMRKQLQREAAARNEGLRQGNERAGVADTATNGANAGLRSGGGHSGPVEIPEEVQPLLANFQRRLQDACKVLTIDQVTQCLNDFISDLNGLILEALEKEKAKATQQPEVAPPDISEEDIEATILASKPEWYSKEEWLSFTDENREDILNDPEADKDSPQYIAWEANQPLGESEESAIMEAGNELDDAANA